MSDYNRKDLTEQAKEKITPDNQKSYTQQVGEQFSGATDRVKAAITPESHKGTAQSTFDSARGAHDDAKNHPQGESQGLLDKAKDALGINKQQ
ncbi:heat shock protein 9/12-domain-containing protein [Endogone sp. FLAS-F59071]|nr:heat shock protein 9/12-domain-containing protein [Endogone sp. FLAS-F59071]|eukprot:RUS21436.1 heat shock protein 9/12-domain-containing protein [Endogone sp. FLAS-F59071]